MISFEDSKDGVHLQYPADWSVRADKDYVLRLVRGNKGCEQSVTLDIPNIPFHFPGMIKFSLIESEYLKDQKSQHPGLQLDLSADYPIGRGAKARLTQMSWKHNDTAYNDVALLIIRGEQVYILAADTDSNSLPAMRADFDRIAGSLQWDK